MLISGIGKVRPFGRSPRRLRTYAPESLALFAAMTPAPNTSQKNAIDTLIRAALPFKAKLDWFNPMHSYASQPSLLNWFNPSQSAVPVNSPVFTPFSGWQGDGVSAYITIPAVLSAYLLNDAHFAAQQTNITTASSNLRSVGDSRAASPFTTYLTPLITGGIQTVARINTDESIIFSNTDPRKYFVINKTASAGQVYSDGIMSSEDLTYAGTGVAQTPFLLLRLASFYSAARLSLFHFGGALTPAEISTLNTAWLAYKAAMV